jgi:hypothetical protein
VDNGKHYEFQSVQVATLTIYEPGICSIQARIVSASITFSVQCLHTKAQLLICIIPSLTIILKNPIIWFVSDLPQDLKGALSGTDSNCVE